MENLVHHSLKSVCLIEWLKDRLKARPGRRVDESNRLDGRGVYNQVDREEELIKTMKKTIAFLIVVGALVLAGAVSADTPVYITTWASWGTPLWMVLAFVARVPAVRHSGRKQPDSLQLFLEQGRNLRG